MVHMKAHRHTYNKMDLFNHRVYVQNSTIASTYDGLVFQYCNLSFKLVTNMTGGGGITQDKAWRNILRKTVFKVRAIS